MLNQARILAWLLWDSAGFFEWLANQPWYTQILTDWVASMPLKAGDSGLEVGCGPGQLAAQLHNRGITVTGLDRSSKMVGRARRRVPECTFVEGDALALPFEADTLDLAVAASVVNVVSAPQTVVNEMVRVVRPGGWVSVLFPTPRLAEDAAEITNELDLRGLTAAALAFWGARARKCEPAAIEALFREAGLVDVCVEKVFHDTVAGVTGKLPRTEATR